MNLESGFFLFLRNREDGLQVNSWFAVLYTLGDDAKRQGLYFGNCLFASCAVYNDTRQVWNLCDPAPIIFLIHFDAQYCHGYIQPAPTYH